MNPSYSTVPESTSPTPPISTSIINRMNVKVFKAAQEGNIEALTKHSDNLHQMLTPSESTVLHVYIASLDNALLTKSQALVIKSAEVVTKMLRISQKLLLLPNKHGDTALHLAARHGRAEIVRSLMQAAKYWRGRDIEEGSTKSTEGCQQRFLIRRSNKEKNTALHEAVRFNHLDVVKILIEKDPEFEYPANDAGETPLYIVAERGYNNLVFEMLSNCTSPSYEGPDGRTALHIAAAQGHQQITGRILKKEKKLALIVDKEGYTPLHLAALKGHVSIVKQILECDDSTAYVGNNDLSTPVHFAALNGHIDVMEQFLLYCPDSFELVDSNGWNTLHYAISKNRDKVEEFVRKYPWLSSIFLNRKNSDGNAPLHQIAMSDKAYNGLKFIHDSNVDKLAFNNDNMNALDIIQHNVDSLWKRNLQNALKYVGATEGQRLTKTKDSSCSSDQVEAKTCDKDSSEDSTYKEIKESHMVVSALIATVTFAAGFTVPGGYQSDKGPDQGLAVLSKNAAFKAFIITNTLAMCMSSCAVMIRFSLSRFNRKFTLDDVPYALALDLTMYALNVMVIAFLTGTYAVLGGHDSSGLAIAVPVVGCFVFFGLFGIMFLPFLHTLRDGVTKMYYLISWFQYHLVHGNWDRFIPKSCKF